MTSEHTEELEQMQGVLEDSEIAITITNTNGEIESRISIDSDVYDEDYELLKDLMLMLGSGIHNLSEMTAFEAEETAVVALEHFEVANE